MRKYFLTILLISLSFSITYSQNIKYHNLSAEIFYTKINLYNNNLLLDVRTFAEYRKSRIANSVYAGDKNELIRITKSLDKNNPILVYCSNGERSLTVCNILTSELNFKNVYNLKYGLLEWQNIGYVLDKTKIKKNYFFNKK